MRRTFVRSRTMIWKMTKCARYVMLVPSQDELLRVTKNYGVSYAKIDLKDSFMKYSIGHSGVLYVFDENGRLLAEISNPLREEITQTLLKFR